MQENYIDIEGIKIFYRETGISNNTNLILFHGFPSSSFMYRNLIKELENDYHIIAMDYVGFGKSDAPSRDTFNYTFDNLSIIVEKFLIAKGITDFYMYVFDYGAPIGFRIAVKHPNWIKGIISQNGNTYEEGLGEKWKARAEYWKNPTKKLREQYKSAFAPDTIIGQYTFGTEEGSVSSEGYNSDIEFSRTIPDYAEIQSDLIFDYQNNVKMYPIFQEYLRNNQPPLLAVWGKNDPSFIPSGANAFKKDLPNAEIHLVDSGHFALESKCKEIARYIKEFIV